MVQQLGHRRPRGVIALVMGIACVVGACGQAADTAPPPEPGSSAPDSAPEPVSGEEVSGSGQSENAEGDSEPAGPEHGGGSMSEPAGPEHGGGSMSEPAGTQAEAEEFDWSLPGGDLSLDAIGDVFNSLVAGRCDEALTDLEVFLINDPVWSPGQEQLYRAAIATCSGDLGAARAHLQDSSLTRHAGDCRLFKAVVSVLEQRPQESVECPPPATPPPPPPDDGDSTGGEPSGETTPDTSSADPGSTQTSDPGEPTPNGEADDDETPNP